MANAQHRHEHDSIGTYIKEANRDFFGSLSSVDATTTTKALTGFVVFAVGLALIISQIV